MQMGFRHVLQNTLHGHSAIREIVIQGKTSAWLKIYKRTGKPMGPYMLIITKVGVHCSVFLLVIVI